MLHFLVISAASWKKSKHHLINSEILTNFKFNLRSSTDPGTKYKIWSDHFFYGEQKTLEAACREVITQNRYGLKYSRAFFY